MVRSDRGTENVQVQALQIGLRTFHDDAFAGQNSFLMGKSTQNQRVESFWVQLQRLGMRHYMDIFKEMTEQGILDVKNKIQIECLRYCFGSLISHDLHLIRKEWNNHRIRKQTNRKFPGGRPNILFGLPENYNAADCSKPVHKEDINILCSTFTVEPQLCSPSFEEVVSVLMPNFKNPCKSDEALKTYVELWGKVCEHMQSSNL